jgi:hypothetical protein
MKREIVDYEVRGFKEVGDDIKQVARKLTFEVDEMPILSEEDYYCVVHPKGTYMSIGEDTDELFLEKSGEHIFTKDQIDEIVAEEQRRVNELFARRKTNENAEVKVYTLKKILSTDFYYSKDNKMIFNNYFTIQIKNIENLPSNILEIFNKLNLLLNVFVGIIMDDIDVNLIDKLIKKNFIIE